MNTNCLRATLASLLAALALSGCEPRENIRPKTAGAAPCDTAVPALVSLVAEPVG